MTLPRCDTLLPPALPEQQVAEEAPLVRRPRQSPRAALLHQLLSPLRPFLLSKLLSPGVRLPGHQGRAVVGAPGGPLCEPDGCQHAAGHRHKVLHCALDQCSGAMPCISTMFHSRFPVAASLWYRREDFCSATKINLTFYVTQLWPSCDFVLSCLVQRWTSMTLQLSIRRTKGS